MAIGLFLGNFFNSKNGYKGISGSNGQEKYQTIQDILDILDNRYVDSLNSEKLFEETISDMLHKLDPHSNYIPAKELKAMNESLQGEFGGIGVRFFVIRDTICVTHVIKNSPSEKVGIKAGDKFIKISGQTVAGKKISNDKIMSMLKGIANTTVSVQILRNGHIIPKQITRGTIPISSILFCYNH